MAERTAILRHLTASHTYPNQLEMEKVKGAKSSCGRARYGTWPLSAHVTDMLPVKGASRLYGGSAELLYICWLCACGMAAAEFTIYYSRAPCTPE